MRLAIAALLLLPSLAFAQADAPTGPGHIGTDAFAQPDLAPALLLRLDVAQKQIDTLQQERALLMQRVQELERGCTPAPK